MKRKQECGNQRWWEVNFGGGDSRGSGKEVQNSMAQSAKIKGSEELERRASLKKEGEQWGWTWATENRLNPLALKNGHF